MMRAGAARDWMLRMLCAAGLAASTSCNSPTAPSIDGAWAGTWQFVTAGVTVTDTVTATFSHSGANVSGTWSSQGGASGQLTLTTGSTVTGSITITRVLATGPTCTATTALAGTASATTLDFTLTDVAPAGLCQWATANHFVLTKS